MKYTFNKFINSHSIKKLLVLAMLFVLNSGYSQTINPFITTWQTDASQIITIPLTGAGYDFSINWGDGTAAENKVGSPGNISHTYVTAGVYTVTITPTVLTGFPRIYLNSFFNRTFLKTITQWGGGQWSNMQRAFFGATTMDVTATDSPNLSIVTDFQYMFLDCNVLKNANGSMSNWTFTSDPTKNITMANMFQSAILFNQNISAWNMTRVTNTSAMFNNATAFNQDISAWDVSNVTTMANMFVSTKFNQNINAWNVANVTDMSVMFQGTTAFNQPLNAWNVSKVTTMASMFQSSVLFNQDISAWNVIAVTNMVQMFYDAKVFNQNISAWNVSNVTNMTSMFRQMPLFNQPLDAWGTKTSKVTIMQEMFRDSPVFNQTINSWDVSSVTNMQYMFLSTNSFNQSLNSWVLTNLTNANGMFQSNTAFNGDLSGWQLSTDPTKNINLSSMFNSATKFNRDISAWNVIRVTNMNAMFISTSLFNQDLSAWDVSNVTDMGNMFNNSQAFNMPLSWGVKTAKVTNMNGMFQSAKLFNQDISGWDVSKVTTMVSMFQSSQAFNQDISAWNVSAVNNMGSMFYDAKVFNKDISLWNVSNVTNMSSMFRQMPLFNQPLDAWGIKTSKVTNMQEMFRDSPLFNQPLNSWDMSKVTTTLLMFYRTNSFNQDLNSWNLSSLTNGTQMFQENTAFNGNIVNWQFSTDPTKNIDLSNMFNGTTKFNRDISTWNVIRVTNMSAMFINTSVFNQDLSAWDVSNVTNMSNMFNNAQAFNMPLNWGVKTAKVLNMSNMFQSTRLFNQDIIGWNVSAVTNMSSMFVNNPVFNQNIGSWNVANVTNMVSMFQSALMFNQNIGNWNVAKVTNMTSMFENNPVFNQSLNLWNVNKVTAFTSMFRSTTLFNGDISAWQIGTTSAVNMQYMFLNAAKFNQNIGAWNVSKVNNMISMFQGCVSFSQDLGNWDISSLTGNNAANIFYGVNLCRANYNSILLGWSTLSAGETVVPSNLTNMNFGTSKYSNTTAVVAARLVLTGTKIWGITDGGVESDYTPPVISSSNNLAPNNTTIAVTFDSRVYNNCNGAGNIDVNDFVLSVSGGAAVLASPTPISITTANNTTFTIGISYSTVANGSETLTISPAGNAIFDLQGNDMATVQTSNTARLNDVTPPVITGPGPSVASTSSMSLDENILNVTTFTANETVTWSKANTNDGALFSINASGVLTFIARPDYEVPTDSDANNTYIVSVIATDAVGLTTTQTLTITINDIYDLPATFGNFDNVTKTVFDVSYTISAPTSNNTTGAFSFTSSNTNVATITGTTVTILAPGTTTITATQASDGYYIETATTATLTVSNITVVNSLGQLSNLDFNYVNTDGKIGGGGGITTEGNAIYVRSLLKIGDNYQGGIIGYILQRGDPGFDYGVQHGLIVAPSDQSTSVNLGTYGSGIQYVTPDDIGAGQSNTTLVAPNVSMGGIYICDNLVLNSKTDWFLPSKNELMKIYENRIIIGGFITTGNKRYWTSSFDPGNSNFSYSLDFTSGIVDRTIRTNNTNQAVRAIRYF